MRMPELPALRASLATTPLPGARGGPDGAFAQAMRSTQAEITELVRNGWPAGELPALGAEGWMHRSAALRAALQPQPAEPAVPLSRATVSTPQQGDFLTSIAPWAREAGAALGVAPELVAAHAALESGWGQRPLRGADGQDSHNLFGLKARGGWQGDSVQALTTEFEDGTAQKTTESFRAYPDHATAFRDYTRLLQNNPRYQAALNVGGDAGAFAQALAQGGYATDPAYAAKLTQLATQLQARTAGSTAASTARLSAPGSPR